MLPSRRPTHSSQRHQRELSLLKDKVRHVKTAVPPPNAEHARYSQQHYNNRKCNVYRDARLAEIDRSNEVLVGHIAGTVSDYADPAPFRLSTLNAITRKREQLKIKRENLNMASRIVGSQMAATKKYQREVGAHSQMHDTLVSNISKYMPNAKTYVPQPRTGYHEFIQSGYSKSAGPRNRRPSQPPSKLYMTAGVLLPPIGSPKLGMVPVADDLEASYQDDHEPMQVERDPQLAVRAQAKEKELNTSYSDIADALPETMYLFAANTKYLAPSTAEKVALTANPGACPPWKLEPAPPGAAAAKSISQLYFLVSGSRWLTTATSGEVFTSDQPGTGKSTSKWLMQEVGGGRYRVGAWREDDVAEPGGYLCVDPDGAPSVMRPPQDAEQAKSAEALFHWEIKDSTQAT